MYFLLFDFIMHLSDQFPARAHGYNNILRWRLELPAAQATLSLLVILLQRFRYNIIYYAFVGILWKEGHVGARHRFLLDIL